MAYKEFLHFKKEEYKQKLAKLAQNVKEHKEIQKREVEKIRQIYGAWTKMGLGCVGAIFTMGATLMSSSIGGRQLYIACHKLQVIQETMRTSSIPFHVETKRDVVVPVVAAFIGLGIGLGVDLGVDSIINSGASGAMANGITFAPVATGGETVAAAAAHPAEFLAGALHGGQTEVIQATSVFGPGDLASNSAHATIETAIPATSGTSFIDGAELGHGMAANMESHGASIASQQAAQVVLEQGSRILPDKKNSASKAYANRSAVNVSKMPPPPPPPPMDPGCMRALVMHNFAKGEPEEINLVEGEYVVVTDNSHDSWWTGRNARGDTGFFPKDFVRLVREGQQSQTSPQETTSMAQASSSYGSTSEHYNQLHTLHLHLFARQGRVRPPADGSPKWTACTTRMLGFADATSQTRTKAGENLSTARNRMLAAMSANPQSFALANAWQNAICDLCSSNNDWEKSLTAWREYLDTFEQLVSPYSFSPVSPADSGYWSAGSTPMTPSMSPPSCNQSHGNYFAARSPVPQAKSPFWKSF